MNTFHTPVLEKEVVDGLRIIPGEQYIDATVGGGGHLLRIAGLGGRVLGIDTDHDALRVARQRIDASEADGTIEKGSVTLVYGNFRTIGDIAEKNGWSAVRGILFDLGVSSFQLDTPGRGFSYRFEEAPLDLRLDQTVGITAADILKSKTAGELYEIFTRFGEEELADKLSYGIVRARAVDPIETTGDLVRIVSDVQTNTHERQKMLSRVFQALRIAVNDEFAALREGLAGAQELLVSGGRLAVITFHSLEDRIVKKFMGADGWEYVTKKHVTASLDELEHNRRSRSAKLRIVQKL